MKVIIFFLLLPVNKLSELMSIDKEELTGKVPNGKNSRQTQRTGRMAQKPASLLHLASLEETRKEKEKPDSVGS